MIFVWHVEQQMADKMNNAKLNLRFRKYGFNRFGKTFESIHTGYEDVLNSAILQFGDDLHLELGSLSIGCPDAKHFFEAGQGYAKCQINGFVNDESLTFDLYF